MVKYIEKEKRKKIYYNDRKAKGGISMTRMERLYDIARTLLVQTDFITIQTLAGQAGVSQRTVISDLASRDFLRIIAPATLIKKPNKGIFLEADWKTKSRVLARLKTSVYLNDEKESDYGKILLDLLSGAGERTAEDFCEDLYISNTTLYALLQKVEEFADRYGCRLEHHKRKGYVLAGEEEQLRQLFFDFAISSLGGEEEPPARLSARTFSILNHFLYENEIKRLLEILGISESILNTNYVDEDYNRLALQLCIQAVRLRSRHTVKSGGQEGIRTTQEYYHAALLKTYLERELGILYPDPEVAYMAVLLLGTRKQANVSLPYQNMEYLEKFINLLSIRLNVELSHDYELKQSLMDHLKPAIHRMKYGLVSENPLLEQIRMEYTEVYMAVVTAIEDLECMEHIFFDSNEIGYICLHIIAAVNRPANRQKIKAALLCNEGLSIEIFLKNLVEAYFDEIRIQDIFRENTLEHLAINDYDLILNTTSHRPAGRHVVNISINFTQKDLGRIRHFLVQQYRLSQDVPMEALYQNYLLFFKDDSASSRELLQKYCRFLQEEEYVQEGFYESVVQRMKSGGTYIARGIALPHGLKDKVLSSVILMIRLEHPIEWDKEAADFVILVAANDADAKNYSRLFRKIMKIVSVNEHSQMLKDCQSIEQLQALLEKV